MLERTTGMPLLVAPGELPRESQLTLQEIRDEYVSYEGLGFCIFHYIPSKRIADPKLRDLWRKAKAALRDVVDCLESAPESLDKPRFKKHRPKPEKEDWQVLLEE